MHLSLSGSGRPASQAIRKPPTLTSIRLALPSTCRLSPVPSRSLACHAQTYSSGLRGPDQPRAAPAAQAFDVADLYRGPVAAGRSRRPTRRSPLDEKLRQAYFWIVNTRDHQPALRHRVQRRAAAVVRASATRKSRVDAAVGAELLELRAAAAADLRHAAHVPVRRRAGARQDRQRDADGRAGRLLACARCAGRCSTATRR